jgi:hypothetical protein
MAMKVIPTRIDPISGPQTTETQALQQFISSKEW